MAQNAAQIVGPSKEEAAAAHYIKLFKGWPDNQIQKCVEQVWALRGWDHICKQAGIDPAGTDFAILDVAGGLTTVNRLLSARKRCVIDICISELRKAGFKLPPGIEFIAGSAQAMPFADRTFTHVFCTNALDHFEDPIAALREMQRVLRDEGTCIIAVTVFRPDQARGPRDILHPQTFTQEAVEQLLSLVFRIASVERRAKAGMVGYNRAARGMFDPRMDKEAFTYFLSRP